ncbi:hypothetical protein Fcan01_15892 [Folsomia candida]|uniref:Uncharacterized protein n=1 Tax=Folsomia candida TaxID=158441 RepID=A0A226DXW0_FOLCA|nr:hypothetical protein Fcan01_15892 [Folsomia candida]
MTTGQILAHANSPLAVKMKRHLKYGDTFLCTFPTWDEKKNEVVSRNKRHHKIVHFLHFLHLLLIWIQLYCTLTKATSLLETAEALGITIIIFGCANYSDGTLTWKLVYFLFDVGEQECLIIPACITILAILLPCKAPLLSANFCQNSHLELNFAKRFVLIMVEVFSLTTLLISADFHCILTLVPCLSFLLTELKWIENIAGGISDYRKLQVLEKIVNSVLRDRIFAVMGTKQVAPDEEDVQVSDPFEGTVWKQFCRAVNTFGTAGILYPTNGFSSTQDVKEEPSYYIQNNIDQE